MPTNLNNTFRLVKELRKRVVAHLTLTQALKPSPYPYPYPYPYP